MIAVGLAVYCNAGLGQPQAIFEDGFEQTDVPPPAAFADDFDALRSGPIDGQNGWSLAGAGNWDVLARTGSGNVLEQTNSFAGNLFYLNNVVNGGADWTDQRLRVDFSIPAQSFRPQAWLRKTAASGDGGGYLLFHNEGSWEIATHNADAGAQFDVLGRADLPVEVDQWYTLEFWVIDRADGTPELSAYVYPQGSARPASPILSVVDDNRTYASGYFGLGVNNGPVSYDNVRLLRPAPAKGLRIFAPARAVAGAPQQATRAIRDDNGAVFHIPYLQTSSTLRVAAQAAPISLPAGGGVRFELVGDGATRQTVHDLEAPFTATFSGLSRGNYSVEATLVDSGKVPQTGATATDRVTGIGIGDIIAALGDSITEGWNGLDYGTEPITNWLDAAPGSVSDDLRNYPQHGPQQNSHRVSFLNQLNNTLTAHYGYPVFVMNEGRYAYDAVEYAGYMAENRWRERELALQPNKWLLHLGANDAWVPYDATEFRANMQRIVDDLVNDYGAQPSNIWVAQPAYHAGDDTARAVQATYLEQVDDLIAGNGLSSGPDFFGFYQAYAAALYDDGIHPNVAGFTEMARLWGIAMMQPTNLSVAVEGTTVTLSWDDLATVEPSISHYYLRYGTASGSYTDTLSVAGNSATYSGLAPARTYYVVVSGHDNDSSLSDPNETRRSAELSFITATLH